MWNILQHNTVVEEKVSIIGTKILLTSSKTNEGREIYLSFLECIWGENELLRITSLFAFLLLREETVVLWVGSPDNAYPPKSIDIREGRSIGWQSLYLAWCTFELGFFLISERVRSEKKRSQGWKTIQDKRGTIGKVTRLVTTFSDCESCKLLKIYTWQFYHLFPTCKSEYVIVCKWYGSNLDLPQ